jgi:hypothetical protein
MNNIPKPGGTSKKKGRPRNDLDLNSLAVRQPIPQGPVLNIVHKTELPSTTSPVNTFSISPVIKSPIDQTPIIINGKVVDLESELEERVNKASPVIRPITPQVSQEPPQTYEKQNTPPSLPLNEVNIVESPQVTPKITINPEPVKEEVKIESESEYESEDSEEEIIPNPAPTLSSKPLNFTALLTENKNLSPVSDNSSEQSEESESNQSTPKNDPFQIMKNLNLIGSHASDSEDSYDESEEESEEEILIPTINMPEQPSLPAISGRIRADSPIETIGAPNSPGIGHINVAKPMFNPEGKSYTPRKVSSPLLKAKSPAINKIQEDSGTVPLVRNVITPSPKPKVPSPSAIRPGLSPSPRTSPRASPRFGVTPKPQTIRGPEMFFAPQNNQQNSSIFGGRPDYSKMTVEQQVFMRTQFTAKFGILRSSYPDWNIRDPDDRLTLDQIHDIYEYYIRQIMVSKETGQYKVYLVIFFMFVEVVGVKLLKLNMSGYTMSQLRIMNRYDTLLAELGEKWLVSSGSEWPVEARLLMMATFNAVIFIAVRYLCSWMGVDGLAETIQNFVDNMLNGPQQNLPGAPGMSVPAAPPPPPQPSVHNPAPQSSGNPLDGLASAFSGLFGGNSSTGGSGGGGFTEGIAKLGTMFTNKMQQSNKAAAATAAANPKPAPSARPSGVKSRIDKRTLFG